eukprot:CAMPEP_0185854086 /NCGR_PEP_ID=MMETSP1354-20130828/21281_1 /TAXON_ID=708628 /ORGANISM="Erythrolobus madagascarensis, Strain CCMP3276" /LENGTH=41 /DNA_ID= /DNA_START= /DNA_END= /DNA_ORIENTATION=
MRGSQARHKTVQQMCAEEHANLGKKGHADDEIIDMHVALNK